MSLHQSAIAYAQRGWYVLPLYGVRDGVCGCGRAECKSPGKHPYSPLTPSGLTQASDNPLTVGNWWAEAPGCNVGIATGPGSGLVVIDIDPRSGGNYTLDELEHELDFPRTLTAETGSGGSHLIYAYPHDVEIKSRSGALGPGVDIKARGGYIVAPPSKHVSGGEYSWEASCGPDDIPPTDLPLDLKNRLCARRGPATASAGQIGEGHRNQTMFDIAAGLRRLGSSPETISATLHMENSARCVPMLDDEEIDGITASASRYEPADPLLLHPERMLEYFLRGQPTETGYCLNIVDYLGDSEPAPESEDWWVHGIVPKAAPMIFAGPPKSAKSIVTLDLAVSMALGQDWVGQKTERAKVMYLSLEDSKTTTRRRVWHMLRARGAKPSDLDGWLAIDSDFGFFFEIDRFPAALSRAIEEFGPSVVIIDSLARSTGCNENSKEEMARVTVPWQEIVRKHKVTVGVIHHFKKASKESDGSDIPLGYRLRGSSDLYAFVRHIVGIEKVAGISKTSRIETVGNYAVEHEPFAIQTVAGETDDGETLSLKYLGNPENALSSSLEAEIIEVLTKEPQTTTALAKLLRKRRGAVIDVCSDLETEGTIFRASERSPWRVKF